MPDFFIYTAMAESVLRGASSSRSACKLILDDFDIRWLHGGTLVC